MYLLPLTYGYAVDVPVVDPSITQSGHVIEAGGLVFDDGSGWGYGRGVHVNLDAERTAPFSYVRDTDYGSAACAMVPRTLFVGLGLYDPR